MSQNKILMCGLPASGKTTYLSALWYLLTQREIKTCLSLVELPPTCTYLNMLSARWCRLNEVARTGYDEIQTISLRLMDGISEVDLHVPDMSGETWENIWNSRSCVAHAIEWASEATGVMLFLHADNIRPPVDLLIFNEMVEEIDDTSPREEIAWGPELAPTQVVLVDILQAISSPPLGANHRRLVVIISAWDKAEGARQAPEEYLKSNLPLLYQFLKYGNNFTDVKIVGVSAQGGDLTSADDFERLSSENLPSRRIKIVEEGDIQHDLTIPIKWLMA